eukprot:5343933-Pleurochrysis_carterae.AAC.4
MAAEGTEGGGGFFGFIGGPKKIDEAKRKQEKGHTRTHVYTRTSAHMRARAHAHARTRACAGACACAHASPHPCRRAWLKTMSTPRPSPVPTSPPHARSRATAAPTRARMPAKCRSHAHPCRRPLGYVRLYERGCDTVGLGGNAEGGTPRAKVWGGCIESTHPRTCYNSHMATRVHEHVRTTEGAPAWEHTRCSPV